MKTHEVEAWALRLVDAARRGHSAEDSRVELKAQWIAPEKFARRLAGHANASGGADILWIIGVDERTGVTGVGDVELSTAWGAVKAQFDGPSPSLLHDVTSHVDDRTIHCLLFSTEGAPYVVKNPAFGSERGESVQREVPWREGTAVRSATHEDLIRILSPLATIPNLEVLDGSLHEAEFRGRLKMILNVYVDSERDLDIVIPFHRCESSISFPGTAPVSSSHMSLQPRTETLIRTVERLRPRPQSLSPAIVATQDEVFISGPGRLTLTSQFDPEEMALKLIGKADGEFRATLRATRATVPILVSAHLRYREGATTQSWDAISVRTR